MKNLACVAGTKNEKGEEKSKVGARATRSGEVGSEALPLFHCSARFACAQFSTLLSPF